MTKRPNDTTYTNVLLEDINSRFDVLSEGIAGIYQEVASMHDTLATKADLAKVKTELKTDITLVRTDINLTPANPTII